MPPGRRTGWVLGFGLPFGGFEGFGLLRPETDELSLAARPRAPLAAPETAAIGPVLPAPGGLPGDINEGTCCVGAGLRRADVGRDGRSGTGRRRTGSGEPAADGLPAGTVTWLGRAVAVSAWPEEVSAWPEELEPRD